MRIGDRVQLTSEFLRNTGQQRGGEGTKRFEVIAVDGDFVHVDEHVDLAYFTEEEIQANPLLVWRRIKRANLEVIS
jgi:hypothetical protein